MLYSIRMATIGQRRDPIRLLWRRLGMLGLCVLVFFTAWAVWGVYWKQQESYHQRTLSENHLEDLSQRQSALVSSIKSLDTERGKEQALRNVYTVGREGEKLVVIVDQAPATNTMQATSTPMQWFKKIFGR